MPNWVNNGLGISGSAEDIKAIKEQVSKSFVTKEIDSKFIKNENGEGGEWVRTATDTVVDNPVFSYWNIIRPKPEELDDYYCVVGTNGKSATDPTGWYGWNLRHWGVKWDASQPELVSESETSLNYGFQSPWGFPDNALLELSRQYPNATLELHWEEEQGFGGIEKFCNGEVEEVLRYESKCYECDELDTMSWCEECDNNVCSSCNQGEMGEVGHEDHAKLDNEVNA